MQVSVTFRHMDSQESLKEYASHRVKRVKKYMDNPLEAQVILSVEKFRHIAEVTINGNGITIHGCTCVCGSKGAAVAGCSRLEKRPFASLRKSDSPASGGPPKGLGHRKLACRNARTR